MILCVPTLNQYEKLDRMIDSAFAGKLKPEKIYVVDNGGKYNNNHQDVTILAQLENIGVSRAWNLLLDLNKDQDYIVIANDDIILHEDDLYNIEKHFKENKDSLMCMGGGFSLFGIRLRALDVVGYFDEKFSPAYFEDNDYHYRIKLAGTDIDRIELKFTGDVSATVNSFDKQELERWHLMFRKNRGYYVRKWGGIPGEERYTIAFNKETSEGVL